MNNQISNILGKFVTKANFDIRDQKNIEKEKPPVYDSKKQINTGTNDRFKRYMKENDKIINKKNVTKQLCGPIQLRTRYLHIDSRDRDTKLFPNANNYCVNVGKENFTNVVKIEMIASKFTNTDDKDIYIVSTEIGHDFRQCSDISYVFGIIQLACNTGDTIYNSYIGCKKVYFDNSTVELLDKIDFRFFSHSGEYIDFLDTEHYFTLKITELIKKVTKSEYNTKIGHTFN